MDEMSGGEVENRVGNVRFGGIGNGAPRNAALSTEQTYKNSEENDVNFPDLDVLISKTFYAKRIGASNIGTNIQTMSNALVSLIPVLTAVLYVALTGRICNKNTSYRFTIICRNWRQLPKRE